ncbi:hypothetical protein MNBD_ALPHA04-1855 [hydrothermal vent metagenome]|uniref:Uncharacterized protein n=1 Tax=hydrothermal vent metagenome TaxID=652676 RepID=A0A3B0SPY7_9ZZZZ
MTRLSILTLVMAFILAACTGPIETRVETLVPTALPATKIFSFTEKPEQNNRLYQDARAMVASALESKGFSQADSASILVQIALANRPANIGIDVGENEEKTPRSVEKKQKFLQSCKDREHRLIVTLTDQITGSSLYSGIASEYHCKGTLEASLPYLVEAAMADLGSAPHLNIRKRTITRAGLE